MTQWSRLIRFVDGGRVYYGDAVSSAYEQAREIIGNPFSAGYEFGSVRSVQQLLSPIAPSDVKTIRLLGLNYRKHAAETGIPEPQYPVVFNKPFTAVNNPYDPVLVPPMAQKGDAVDYEAELVVVIGSVCKNVSESQALAHVAGYTLGNDVSQRTWQMQLGGGQWNVSKGFDTWAPIGPAIVRRDLLDLQTLRLQSRVNGELRQSEAVNDMIFGVEQAIAFLSAGQTLQPGDLLFMGTPAGVGMGFRPPKYLRHGDVVECSLTGVGSIKNQFVYTHRVDQ